MRIAVLVLLALATAGCGSLLQSNGERLQAYRLEPVTVVAGGEALDGALSVARPRAAESLDTERIAVAQAGSSFDYFAGVRWAEPAPRMLQQMLVDAFVADGRFAVTVASPSRVPVEFLLDVELREFTAAYAREGAPPEVRVQWQATLVDAKGGTRMGSVLAKASVTATANRREAIVQAFQQATDRAIADTVAGVRSASAKAPR
jgi:cholesterol transport system auxiliary component